MRLSIVATLFRSEQHLKEFHERASAAAREITDDYEIILVNDGSPDNSLAHALELRQAAPRTTVIDLSRNFGHHKAMMTGLAHANGELVFLIDSDLEEDPGLLSSFLAKLQATNSDVVYGVQNVRKGSWFERTAGALFYRLFNALSPHPIPPNLLTIRLMTQRYVRALIRHRERELQISGLWVITGFDQTPLLVDKTDTGKTTYTIARKVAHLVDAVTSFSNRPLVLIFYIGTTIFLLASVAATYLVIRRLFFGVLLSGWPSLIVSVWLLGGLNMLCLGVIGIYLSKVFSETKQRPYTIVRAVYRSTDRDEQKRDDRSHDTDFVIGLSDQ